MRQAGERCRSLLAGDSATQLRLLPPVEQIDLTTKNTNPHE
jgi:hypothetical protein